MITTTLKDLRKHKACIEGYNSLVSMLSGVEFNPERETYIRFQHDDPISLLDILKNNGLDDALWSLRASTASERDCRMFAVACARRVEHLSDDPRVKACNDVSERYANGLATIAELYAARDAARIDARDAARVALDAAWDVAWVASLGAARDAARVADEFEERAYQTKLFIDMCNGVAPWQIGVEDER